MGGTYRLPLQAPAECLGVGIGPTQAMVLLVPGTAGVSVVEGLHYRWSPWESVKFGSGQQVEGIGCLEVLYPGVTSEEVDALSAIYVGILSFCGRPGAGRRIDGVVRALGTLFENRMNPRLAAERIVGLVGELVVINSFDDCDLIVAAWHSAIDDRYDFSADNKRLEVKATTKIVREHMFRSTQLPANQPLDLVVASVLVSQTAVGTTISDLVSLIEVRITMESQRQKLVSQCEEIAGSDLHEADWFSFDLESATRSIRYFKSSEIPTSIGEEGVVRIDWTAALHDGPRDEVAEILNGINVG